MDDELTQLVSIESDSAQALDEVERDRAVRLAIHALSPHYRAVIELGHFQDLSYAEIAQTLGLSLNDVKSHMFPARKALAKYMTEHYP